MALPPLLDGADNQASAYENGDGQAGDGDQDQEKTEDSDESDRGQQLDKSNEQENDQHEDEDKMQNGTQFEPKAIKRSSGQVDHGNSNKDQEDEGENTGGVTNDDLEPSIS